MPPAPAPTPAPTAAPTGPPTTAPVTAPVVAPAAAPPWAFAVIGNASAAANVIVVNNLRFMLCPPGKIEDTTARWWIGSGFAGFSHRRIPAGHMPLCHARRNDAGKYEARQFAAGGLIEVQLDRYPDKIRVVL